MILCVGPEGLMLSRGGVEAGGGEKVRWRTSQSSTSSSQSKTTARELHQTSLNTLGKIFENISQRNTLRKGGENRKKSNFLCKKNN